MVAPGALYSTRHMKKALTNTAATTRLTIDPAIFSVLTDAPQEQEDAQQPQQDHEQIQLVGPDEPGLPNGQSQPCDVVHREACPHDPGGDVQDQKLARSL
jgi:hypothetical protein